MGKCLEKSETTEDRVKPEESTGIEYLGWNDERYRSNDKGENVSTQ